MSLLPYHLGTLKKNDDISVRTITFSEDRKYLVTGCVDGIVQVWDWQNNQDTPINSVMNEPTSMKIDNISKNTSYLNRDNYYISQNIVSGNYLISINQEEIYKGDTLYTPFTIYVRELESLNLIIKSTPFPIKANCIAFSHVHKKLVLVLDTHNSNILNQVLEFHLVENGKLIFLQEIPHEKQLYKLSISSQGYVAIVYIEYGYRGDKDITFLEILNLSNQEFFHELDYKNITDILFSPNGTYLAIKIRGNQKFQDILIIYDVSNKIEVQRILLPDSLSMLSFSLDGKYLATAMTRKCITYIWEVNTGIEKGRISHQGMLKDVVFSPIYLSNDEYILATASDTVQLWKFVPSLEIFSAKHSLDDKKTHHKTFIQDTVFSPDGKYIATASHDGYVIIRDIKENQQKYSLCHQYPVKSIVFSLDSKYIATASGTEVKLWDLDQNCEGYGISFKNQGSIVEFHPNQNHLFIVGRNVTLWDYLTGDLIREYSVNSQICSIAVSSDGYFLTVGTMQGNIHIFKISDGESLKFFSALQLQ